MTAVPAGQDAVVLTPHPLQRVGAYALAQLAGRADPTSLSPEEFAHAVARMTDDAVRTAAVPDTKAEDAFWLKASYSFFPNSGMNGSGRKKRSVAQRSSDIREWRSVPAERTWPAAPCALCGRAAVGFFSKVDVPLGVGVGQRNTTPPGHTGLALCWPCVCCFYALPYGCHLTGGQSTAFHSWDDAFLARMVARQVAANQRHLALGVPVDKGRTSPERLALRQLRWYAQPVRGGVELLVFSNNNKDPSLRRHALTEPLAEWLRRTMNGAAGELGYRRLVAVHRTPRATGEAELAYLAFHWPEQIFGRVAAYLVNRADPGPAAADLAPLCYSFLTEVMGVRDTDVKLIRSLAANVATVLAARTDATAFKRYRFAHRDGRRLRTWLERHAFEWTLAPPVGDGGVPVEAFLRTEQYRLLFDPDGDGWFYRQLLLVAVMEELHDRGWRPVDAREVIDELPDVDDELDQIDDAAIDDGQPVDGPPAEYDMKGSDR